MTSKERRTRWVWCNGHLLSTVTPAVRTDDRGFTLGDGLFETVLVRRGRPFRLDRHLFRMKMGAGRLGIPLPDELPRVAREVISENGIEDGGLRITASRGPAPPGLAPTDSDEPTVVVSAFAYRPDPRWVQGGLEVVIGGGRIAEGGLMSGVKALGYGERVQALREARKLGADDALLLNGRGNLVGSTAGNLLLVHEGELRRPSPACGALAGITQEVVVEVASALAIPVHDGPCTPSDAVTAGELILTSSLRGVVPITVLDGRSVGDGEPGSVWRALRGGYESLVREEVE